ncbi:MAG TPA: DUF2281 domain-containing protein [Saprospiraceae bacterium]|nr:DUF2281 domain-containing protein [Saprospiraceae bacterium]HRK82984.1 DUF2281 domain-containing protein [Saprospiraceae bacterium]
MTVTVEIPNEDTLQLLLQLEKMQMLKLLVDDTQELKHEIIQQQVHTTTRGFGCLKGMIHLSPDWDEPLEDMKEYMY